MLAVARLARQLGWGENPMRRRSDQIETAIAWTLLAAFAISIPAAIGVGESSYATQTRHAGQAARGSSAVAVLTDPAPAYPLTPYGGTDPRPLVPAWWPGPDGVVHVGRIHAHLADPAGTVIPIHLDAAGNPAPAPEAATRIAVNAALTGLLVFVVAAAGLEASRRLTRALLDRYRYRAWDAEWQRIGPHWSPHGS